MKKIKKIDRYRNQIRKRKRTRHQFRRKYNFKTRRRAKSKYLSIMAPKRFGITNNTERRKDVLTFINKIHSAVKRKKYILLNFSNTKNMYTCGTLLFASEIINITNSSNTRFKLIPSSNEKVMQVLKQVKLLDIIKTRKKISPKYKDVVNWRFTSGNNVDGSEYESILSHLDDELDVKLQTALFKGLSEAMANTQHHAYIERDKDRPVCKEKQSWWAFSQVKDGFLHVVFCDLGIGIPRSIPIKHEKFYGLITKLFEGKQSDADVIFETITEKKSRTGQQFRGKGLSQLAGTIENIPDAYLTILSNKGGYLVDNDGEEKLLYKDSIRGTLIEWKLPLNHGRPGRENDKYSSRLFPLSSRKVQL